jgi:hypothetical protein
MKRKRFNAMPALPKFLVMLAIFVLASNANAFTSLSLVFGNQVWVNHLIQFQQPMSDPTNEQAVNRFANKPMIERRVSQSHLTLTSKETSLLPHFIWLLHSSQTMKPYLSMTSLLPNFSWLLHSSQMNVQKAHQRRQLNVQRTTRGRADRSLVMCDVSIDSWQCPREIDMVNFQQVGNSASTQLVGFCYDKKPE